MTRNSVTMHPEMTTHLEMTSPPEVTRQTVEAAEREIGIVVTGTTAIGIAGIAAGIAMEAADHASVMLRLERVLPPLPCLP